MPPSCGTWCPGVAATSGGKYFATCRVDGSTRLGYMRDTPEEAIEDLRVLKALQLAIKTVKRQKVETRIAGQLALYPDGLPSGVFRHGDGFVTRARINGIMVCGRTRGTIGEAEDDHAQLKVEQSQARDDRQQEFEDDKDAERDEHAAHLARGQAIYGSSQEKDGLSRQLLKMAFANDAEWGVTDGCEYAIDMHVFPKAEDFWFDETRDAELDPEVLTMAVELKLRQTTLGKENPRVGFSGIHYAGRRCTRVLMIYTPPRFTVATPEAFAASVFWEERASSFAPKCGSIKYSLGKNGGSRPLSEVKDVLVSAAKSYARENQLIPYGKRERKFQSANHARGQQGIDAFERQVLRPMGARLMPPENGLEGNADDSLLMWSNGCRATVQFKVVRREVGQSGFHTTSYRSFGSIRLANGAKKKLFRPYSVDDEVDLFVFLLLDDRGFLLEYWSAYIEDMVFDADCNNSALVTDAHRRGRIGFSVSPLREDIERLGDTAPTAFNACHGMAARTRQWVRALGPIVDPATASALEAQAVAQRRAERRLEAVERAQAAAAAATATPPAPPVAPSTNTFNITNNAHANVRINTAPAKRQRVDEGSSSKNAHVGGS